VEKKEENVKKGLRRVGQIASHLFSVTPRTQKYVVGKIVPIVKRSAKKAIKSKVDNVVKEGEKYVEDKVQKLDKMVDKYSDQTEKTIKKQINSNTPLTQTASKISNQAEKLIDSGIEQAENAAQNQIAKIPSTSSSSNTTQSYVSSVLQGTVSAAKFALLTSLITTTLKNRQMLMNYWTKTPSSSAKGSSDKEDMSAFLRKVREDVLNTTTNVLLQKLAGRFSNKYAFLTIFFKSLRKGSWTESIEYVMLEGAKAGVVKIVGMFFGTGSVVGLVMIGGAWYVIEDLLDWLGLSEDEEVRQKRALEIIKKPQIIKSRF